MGGDFGGITRSVSKVVSVEASFQCSSAATASLPPDDSLPAIALLLQLLHSLHPQQPSSALLCFCTCAFKMTGQALC